MKYSKLVFLFCLGTNCLSAQNADIDLLKQINVNRNTHLDQMFTGITHSAYPLTYGVPAILFGYSLLTKKAGVKEKAIYIGTSVLASGAISTLLKYTVKRDRPYVTYPFIQNVIVENSPSFPSGHTTGAFALATSVSIAFPKWYIILPSYLWAASIGYSRLDLGVHYPTDVLASALIGSGTSYLCYKANKWLKKNKSVKQHY
jgi:membrane-associated phospholipid phosphatase